MTKQKMTLKDFLITRKKGEFFTIQNVDFSFLKRFFNKIWSFFSRKRVFITLASVYTLCVIYGFGRNFFCYYMENNDILIPDASEEEQLNNKQIYINGNFILDLYSYKERFEKDFGKEWSFPIILNKQYLEYWNYFPKKKLILKTKKYSYVWIFDLQYITNTLFQKKFITLSSNIWLSSRRHQDWSFSVKRLYMRWEVPSFKTLKKSPYRDCDDGMCILTNNDWSQYTIETSKYKIPYTGYTMSWDVFVLDIPRTQFIESDDTEYCESFMRPDCVIFTSFIKKPKSFYYDIWIDRKNIQPWDILSIISVE